MRILALAGLFGLALAGASQFAVTQAHAQNNPFGNRYCAQYRGGGENCGFYSFDQCQAGLSGVGGICIVAPMQVEIRKVMTPRGPRTMLRDMID